MNEWEIIGRFVDLDNRLRTLEGRPTVQEKPQPVATLCDAAEALMLFVDQHCNYHDIDPLLADLRHALSASAPPPVSKHRAAWCGYPGPRKSEPEQKRSSTMTHDTYKYRFDESVPAQELEDTFMLAMLAVESLHGRSRVRMESRFNLDKARRTCVIDASTDVGSDLARIFTGFATKEYGERSVLIERTVDATH